uniref:Putative secreted protein n=1 Tax=Anopheles marajoara TaxID=58244 RepID=A0A2M4CBZ6_9DIPT
MVMLSMRSVCLWRLMSVGIVSGHTAAMLPPFQANASDSFKAAEGLIRIGPIDRDSHHKCAYVWKVSNGQKRKRKPIHH